MKNKTETIKIGYKSNFSAFLLLWMGFALLLSAKKEAMLLGAFFIFIAMIVLVIIKDECLVELNEREIVLYRNGDSMTLAVEDVAVWHTNSEGILLVMKDNTQFFVATHETMKAYRALRKILKEKERIE